MTKYTATFWDGHRIAKTSDEVKNRLDFTNWIIKNKAGANHGGLVKIEAEPYGREK